MSTIENNKNKGWYGFDLDGVLAYYDEWRGIENIGTPITAMVDRIQDLHFSGERVKILTARVAPRIPPEKRPNPHGDDFMGDFPDGNSTLKTIKRCPWLTKKEWTAADFIKDWCDDNLGFVPEITYKKDHLMLELYDDRVKQVVPNEGVLVEAQLKNYKEYEEQLKEKYYKEKGDNEGLRKELIRAMRKKIVWYFFLGFVTALNIASAIIHLAS